MNTWGYLGVDMSIPTDSNVLITCTDSSNTPVTYATETLLKTSI